VERKSINFEVKDLDKTKRTAIISHAVYDNIDQTGDISRRGMFTKSWRESRNDISLYFNHDDTQSPGKVTDVYEDNQKAYTKSWYGTHTLGNDVLTMMDEGIITKASFGYITEKKNYIDVKGRRVRELIEVRHLETSVLTKMPANLKAGIESVTKAFMNLSEVKTLTQAEQTILKKIASQDQATLQDLINIAGNLDPKSDLFTWVSYAISRRADMMGDVRGQLKWNSGELKAMNDYVSKLEKFCRNTTASDDCIKAITNELEEAKSLISQHNTAFTLTEPGASVEWGIWLKSINKLQHN